MCAAAERAKEKWSSTRNLYYFHATNFVSLAQIPQNQNNVLDESWCSLKRFTDL